MGDADKTKTIRLMQGVLLVGGVLVTIAWVQLFVLSEDTHRYFAWTIAPPLSAAFSEPSTAVPR